MEERQSRLCEGSNSVVRESNSTLSRVRNVGTIAHIDAGKTTLTERLLHFSGALKAMGEVHDGATLMDYLEQERLRGITIRSANASFAYRKHQINLIDTPGHADFNYEVERALSILEGTLVIIDGAKGVEAQTETVWAQSAARGIPKLVVVNKLDKPGADFYRCVEEVTRRFGVNVLTPTVPSLRADEFVGAIRLDRGDFVDFSHALGETGKAIPSEFEDAYAKNLDRLVEQLSDFRPHLLELYLNDVRGNLFNEELRRALRSALGEKSREFCIAIPCSALKNKGVFGVLDAIADWLPAPATPAGAEPIIFVYRTLFEQGLGRVYVVRIFQGALHCEQRVFSTRTGREVVVQRVLRVQASEFIDIPGAETGDIVGIVASVELESGDSLVSQQGAAGVAAAPRVVEPLFNVSLEFDSRRAQETFVEKIRDYVDEDPSLRYTFNATTNEFLLHGLGELHIEVVLARMRSETGVLAKPRTATVPVVETLRGEASALGEFNEMIRGRAAFFRVEVSAEPFDMDEPGEPTASVVEIDVFGKDTTNKRAFELYKAQQNAPKTSQRGQKISSRNFSQDEPLTATHRFASGAVGPLFPLSTLDFEELLLVARTLEDSLNLGPLTGSRVANIRLRVTGGGHNSDYFDKVALRAATSKAARSLLTPTVCAVLEPCVTATIDVALEHVDEVVGDVVGMRGGKVVNQENVKDRAVITSIVPLESTAKYAHFLRSATSGDARFTFCPVGYSRMKDERLRTYLARRKTSSQR